MKFTIDLTVEPLRTFLEMKQKLDEVDKLMYSSNHGHHFKEPQKELLRQLKNDLTLKIGDEILRQTREK